MNTDQTPFDEFFGSDDPIQGPYSGLTSTADSAHFPTLYTFDDALSDMAMSPATAPILGVSGTGEPLTVDLESESPHVLIAGGSGGGKSGIARAIAAQMLGNGDHAIFLDAKQHSHTWAKGLPNVKYAETFPQIGNAWHWLGLEVHRRNAIVNQFMWAHRDDPSVTVEDAPVGPRIVVVAEELNATMHRLAQMTASYDSPGSRRPKRSPALDAMGDVMFMGRAAKIHVVAIAQYASATAMGGGEIRENFNTRIMVNFTANQWRMLARDVDWPRGCPEQKGRGYTVRSGKARETQYLYLSEQEARAYVLARLSPPVSRPSSPSPVSSDLPATFKP